MQGNPFKILFVKEPKGDNGLFRTLLCSLGDIEVEFASTTEEYMHAITCNPDIHAVLLDAELHDSLSAIEAYSLLKLKRHPLPTALMTNKPLEACLTADLDICDTIPKPFTVERLQACLGKLKQSIAYRQFISSGGLYVPVISNKIIQLTPNDILFIESVNRTVYVHTIVDSYETKVPIKLYEQYLIYNDYFLTHRSCLVNLNKIVSVSDYTIHFKNSDKSTIIAEEKHHIFMQRFQIHSNQKA